MGFGARSGIASIKVVAMLEGGVLTPTGYDTIARDGIASVGHAYPTVYVALGRTQRVSTALKHHNGVLA